MREPRAGQCGCPIFAGLKVHHQEDCPGGIPAIKREVYRILYESMLYTGYSGKDTRDKLAESIVDFCIVALEKEKES